MSRDHSVPFHLIYSSTDYCLVDGCKWCASMRPWIERNENPKPTTINPRPKLDANAPEFVPAAMHVAQPPKEIYATPKQAEKVQMMYDSNDFKFRSKSASSSRTNSPDYELKDLLHRLTGLENQQHLLDPLEFTQEPATLEPLLREESRASINAKAWQLATDAFNETLLECVPRLVQYSGGFLAHEAVTKINDCEEVIVRMGQEGLDRVVRLGHSVQDDSQVNMLLDMRLDTIATILEMKREEVKVIQEAKQRAIFHKGALRAEMENTCRIFDALEIQLQLLHREAARLRSETAEMRAVVAY